MTGKVLLAGMLLIAVLVGRCTDQSAGGGTETTNGIYGTVTHYTHGTGNHQALVAAIYSVNYRPDVRTGIADTLDVDAWGNFSIIPPKDLFYNLFVWDTLSGNGIFLPGLPADTALGSIELEKTSILVVSTPFSWNDRPTGSSQLVIEGSPFYGSVRGGEAIYLSMIPPGSYTIHTRIIPISMADILPEIIDTVRTITIEQLANDTIPLDIP